MKTQKATCTSFLWVFNG